MRAGERDLLHDPVAGGDFIVNGDAGIRKRAHPCHRVLGRRLASFDSHVAGRLEDGVLTVEFPDPLLVVAVKRTCRSRLISSRSSLPGRSGLTALVGFHLTPRSRLGVDPKISSDMSDRTAALERQPDATL